ncbi:MAG TPA: hypothetical protein VMW65_00765 [Chloroflexota bacterium]|nr:hypothetical protein [Chloroflexota bacterium]
MFDPTSRYASLGTATFTTVEGRQVTYVRRRFVPDGTAMPLLTEVTVTQGSRLDLITARTLGDPMQFWRVADANNAMNPVELTEQPGTTLRVPVPQA